MIDGLLNDFARNDLKIKARGLRAHHLMVIRGQFEELDGETPFEEPARKLLFDVLFASAIWGATPDRGAFNRHKILHGELLGYGTAANAPERSLSLTLLLEILLSCASSGPRHRKRPA